MKRTVSIILALLLCISLCACGHLQKAVQAIRKKKQMYIAMQRTTSILVKKMN